MKYLPKLIFVLVINLIINSASAAIDPQQIFDKKLSPSETLMLTKKTIRVSNDVNLPIIAGCFMSAQVYLKLMLPSLGEKKLTSIGLPSTDEANEIFNRILDVIALHKKSFNSDDEYISKIKPYNADYRAYFLDDVGNNQFTANNKRVISWLSACRALTYVQ